jgi:glycosyltransferase involved in cell wall biosynthesis
VDSIRIVAKLREQSYDVVYHGLHALYGDEESQIYYEQCCEEARRLGIEDHVFLNTEFHEIDEVLHELSGVDVVLLPYAQSLEGASAAANISLGAGRPVVTSGSAIFESLKGVTVVVDGEGPEDFAAVIRGLMDNPESLAAIEKQVQRWCAEQSYDRAVSKIIAGFV